MKEYPPRVQVDEKGRAIGPIEYAYAHQKERSGERERHMVINGFIFEDASEENLLVQSRGGKEISGGQGKLDISFGGHFHWVNGKAESMKDVAKQRVQEELFYKKPLPDLEFILIEEFLKQTREFDKEYVCFLKTHYPGPFFMNPSQMTGASFQKIDFILEEIRKNPEDYTRAIRLELPRYIEMRG